jgi:hypothetical protein
MKNESLSVPMIALTSTAVLTKRPYAAPAMTHLGPWTALTLVTSGPIAGADTLFHMLNGKS